jgi:hypothetical protein
MFYADVEFTRRSAEAPKWRTLLVVPRIVHGRFRPDSPCLFTFSSSVSRVNYSIPQPPNGSQQAVDYHGKL